MILGLRKIAEKKRDLSDLCWAVSYGDLYATKIRDLMLDCMLSICLAYGEINHQELQSMAEAYSEIMGQSADLDLLNGLAQERFKLLSTMELGTADPFGQFPMLWTSMKEC